MKQRLDDALTEFTGLNIPNEGLIRHRRKLENQLDSVRSEVRTIVAEPENVVPFLVPGRLLRVSLSSGSENSSDEPVKEWGWGILVNFTKQRINAKNIQQVGKQSRELASIIEQNESHYVLDVYLYVKDRLTSENTIQPGDTATKNGRLGIVPVILHSSTIHSVSSI